jgi:pyruvate carboxylase
MDTAMSEQEKSQIIIVHSAKYQTTYNKKYLNRKKWVEPDPNHINSFIPGTIIEVFVKEGQKVKAGESLMILEAMKMHNDVQMPFDGKVVKVNVVKGQKVPKNLLMIELKPTE